MTFETFRQVVEDAVNTIPEEFTKILDAEGVPIIARENVPERVHELFPNSTVFGIFIGVPINQRNTFAVQLGSVK